MKYTHEIVGTHGGALLPERAPGAYSGRKTPRVNWPLKTLGGTATNHNPTLVGSRDAMTLQPFIRPIHTRGFAPGVCSRGTLREQSSSVCTNDFMGILHPREQNFHRTKCSTIFNRLNIWEQAPGAN